jgi:Flp pilus assembly protein TadG
VVEKGKERGQVLVVMALAFVVLLLFAGLAIDGGALHYNRRRMQNAADAGAMAGTQVLADSICSDQSSATTNDAIYSSVWEFVRRNGVTSEGEFQAFYVQFTDDYTVIPFDPPVRVLSGGAVPNGAVGVAVTATMTQSTYFMGLIGRNETDAVANATAVTGPPMLMGGLRPFGVPQDIISTLDVGDCFTTDFKHCDSDEDDPCHIYGDDGEMMSQHRGWLNFNHMWNAGEDPDFPRASGGGGTADDLMEWMANGFDGILYADCFWDDGCTYGDFVHAKPGTNSSAIGQTPIGESFFIPIFDRTPRYDVIPGPKPPPVPQGSSYYYHIVGFAGVIVPSNGDVNQGGGTVRTCIEEIITGQGQASPESGYGQGGCEAHVMVVTLWE